MQEVKGISFGNSFCFDRKMQIDLPDEKPDNYDKGMTSIKKDQITFWVKMCQVLDEVLNLFV